MNFVLFLWPIFGLLCHLSLSLVDCDSIIEPQRALAWQASELLESPSELRATDYLIGATDTQRKPLMEGESDRAIKISASKAEHLPLLKGSGTLSLALGAGSKLSGTKSTNIDNKKSQSSGRHKRLAKSGRAKIPRIPLATLPRAPKVYSASSTTTTTSTTAGPPSANEDSEESSSSIAQDEGTNEGGGSEKEEETEAASGEYEEIEGTDNENEQHQKQQPSKQKLRSGQVGGTKIEAPTISATETTTTQRPTTQRSTRQGGGPKKTPHRKQAAAAAAAKTKQQAAGEEDGDRETPTSSAESRNYQESDLEGDESNSTAATPQRSDSNGERPSQMRHSHKKKALVALPFLRHKNDSICIREAYLEFPTDLIGDKWRSRGLILIHLATVCYMFYCLALVCERYFMPSLEEFAQRLQLSEDVAGATLMSAGSSAPELFTAILGVFVAKGDVGTGAIVGSAVFNILFVIGICAFVSSTSAQLQWWPVLRDSVYYTFTVLVLIIFIYDERITALESFTMLALYGLYILIMANNDKLREYVSRQLLANPLTAKLFAAGSQGASLNGLDGPDDVFGSTSSSSVNATTINRGEIIGLSTRGSNIRNYQTGEREKTIEDDSMYMAALLVIIGHKRLFRSQIRFQCAARYIIIKRQHKLQQQQKQKSIKRLEEVNYFGPESEPLRGNGVGGATNLAAGQRAKMDAYAKTATLSKAKFSIVSKDDYEFWHRPPQEGENYYLWLAKIPVNYVLHYTCPDCTLYPDKYYITFFVSILWTAFFSYIMVWMVTLIGYTFGIPDSVMGVTFLAAGTSVPDCYSSVHAARNGMADMAVSNSIGSNVFDILIGLSLPWFIQTAIYPGVVATINSRGVIYSVVLLFLSLIITIYLLNKYEWTLKPRLGLALLIAYGLFIVLTCMLEFNLFGHVNPPPCPVA